MNKNKIIELKAISKEFNGEQVLSEISLDIHDNEFVTLLGPSGCGKTTTLRIIAGFETPDSGDVFFDGERINELPPYRRQLNTVFQKYALFPHLNVFENVAFGLRINPAKLTEAEVAEREIAIRQKLKSSDTEEKISLKINELKTTPQKLTEREITDRVKDALKMVNLSGFERRNPEKLSGGQQQRVAIARALVNRPKVLLLDEPLGALDLKLRKDMQNELKNIQHMTGITFIFVTHDQEEALSMSDTVVVMANGKIQQIGSPTDIYNEPVNAFVADFIGESNIIDGMMLADYKVRFAGHTFKCLDKGFDKNEPIDVVVRPEDVDVVDVDKGMLRGVVTSVTFKGVYYEIIVDIGGFKWMIQSTDYVAPEENIGLYIEPDAIHVMKKSEFSDMFGDYSSFSDELEHLSDIEEEEDVENE